MNPFDLMAATFFVVAGIFFSVGLGMLVIEGDRDGAKFMAVVSCASSLLALLCWVLGLVYSVGG